MLPVSNVVNHMPLSEQKGTTPCEQETRSALILTSTYPLLRTCGAISCPTTNLRQDRFRRTEKNRNQCDLLAKTIRETLIKSRWMLKPLLHIRAADSSDRCMLMTFKELIVRQQSWRNSSNFETHNIDSNPAQAFIVLISQAFFFFFYFCFVSFQKNACCFLARYIAQRYIWAFLKNILGLLWTRFFCVFSFSHKARQCL